MKLALVTSTLAGGGAARVMSNMANHWAAQGHHVLLFSFEDGQTPPFYGVHKDVDLFYLDIWGESSGLISSITNNIRRVRTLRQAMKSNRPDVVLSFGDSVNVLAILALLMTGIALIVSERTDPAYDDIGPFWSTLRKLIYPWADMLVVQTFEAATFFDGWRIKCLEVIPNAVVLPRRIGKDPFIPNPSLLAMGRLDVEKNYILMLEAFSQAVAIVPGWSLCIAGDGPMKEELREVVSQLGLDDEVVFLGQVTNVCGLLANVQGFVLSSFFEGFPNALCEAMAAGLACVSTDCPSGPRNIIKHEKNGLLVPNKDVSALAEAMHGIMADEELRQRLGAEAVKLKEQFGMERVMSRWDSCLKNVKE
jgi:glycosyltransferase involved in cell wall biosynthesis